MSDKIKCIRDLNLPYNISSAYLQLCTLTLYPSNAVSLNGQKISIKQASEVLGISTRMLSDHISTLATYGLIAIEKDEQRKFVYINPYYNSTSEQIGKVEQTTLDMFMSCDGDKTLIKLKENEDE